MRTGSQIFAPFLVKADVFTAKSRARMLTLAAIHRLGTLPAARLSVVCYQLKTENAKYLVWNVLKRLESRF